ncbi:hypothetical protein SAMN06297468_0338 [Altererythrobacter xiamenensis]|uniref:Uncharacterized protein n=1 Tax=Altererythrobacter xiamenensis TaxID=1316679 RepID=A0A1Y6EBI2_9SPHN|nr:hypothetical protein [Altererythrobacter xiamenensis]SMQ59866.1 hypothetical protein SAMN06297468_0338 [Altererythrobacter xiamenensis]
MSRITIAFLFITIALIIVSVLLDVPFLRGGSGMIFVAALVYSYIVAKREIELLSYAVKNADGQEG